MIPGIGVCVGAKIQIFETVEGVIKEQNSKNPNSQFKLFSSSNTQKLAGNLTFIFGAKIQTHVLARVGGVRNCIWSLVFKSTTVSFTVGFLVPV